MMRYRQNMNLSHYDLHIHSMHSFDSSISVKQIITRALDVGLSGIAITDHDRLTRINESHPELLVIPGSEVSSDEGHILAIAINESIPSWLSAEETIELIHEQGALAIASHPFSSMEAYPALGDVVYDLKLDGLEVTNPKSYVNNRRARKTAGTLGMARVGGSDAHDIHSIGIGTTVLEQPVETVDDFLVEVRAKRCDGLLRR